MRQSLQVASASLLVPAWQACGARHNDFTGEMKGPNAALGHRLRSMEFEPAKESSETDIVIVGGGIAGLSAARMISKSTSQFKLLELDSDVGGNAIAGKNQTSAFPWGAHYLPIPNDNDVELTAFLQEAGVVTGYENNLPVYNEYYLCFDPKERLYINNYWQDGLLPHAGVPSKDLEVIRKFTERMQYYKELKGEDGKDAFTIPVDFSSQDPDLLSLDNISMETFMAAQGWNSEYLRWYVNYCCADDFGSTIKDTSAWAGIHYFASRKGKGANASADMVLTWPEGNFFLVNALRKKLEANIVTNTLVFRVEPVNEKVEVTYYDASSQRSKKIIAKKVILATPQYISQRILAQPTNHDAQAFQYAPWMVSNITLDSALSERRGESLSWDNVIYGSSALGYVNANHQEIGMRPNDSRVITYYKPLTGSDVKKQRLQAYEKKYEDWLNLILDDLRIPHPEIEKHIKNLDVWLWGHGMIRSNRGFIWGADRRKILMPVAGNIFRAHSDMSGISIFEEAFYRGHQAAQQCLQHL